ncbi:MAG: CMP-N-acetylneuraminic acid synthetase, partial [Parcubacteria group bacterium Gr01-1014_48]
MENSKKYSILGVITARGGSKGIPGKNIKEIGGKPLIAYSIEVGNKSALITDLIISTDDEEIADIAKQWNGHVPFMRPPELAGDRVPHLPVMQHALREMEQRKGCRYDYCVILQPTSPFRIPEDIDETLRKLISSGAESAVTVVRVGSDHPIKIKKFDGDRIIPYVIPEEEGTRRQDFPVAYRRSGAVYAMRR